MTLLEVVVVAALAVLVAFAEAAYCSD